jgi:hypothetical protein
MNRFVLGVSLVLTFVAVGIAAAPPLTFTFSDVHANKTATETDSYAVNNFGTIAGDYLDSNGVQHGMLLGKKSTFATLDYQKCASTIAAYGINNSCAVAGWCIGTSGTEIGFTWANGKFVDVNVPNALGTEPTGINDNGDVVGLYIDSAGAEHGFLKKSGGKFQTIDVPGETSAAAWAINNAGQITVYAVNSNGGFDAFLYNGKTFKNINDPKAGPTGTVVHAVNNKGDIDGTYYDTAGDVHGWLLHGGQYFDVNDPNGASDTRADGLNDTLEIVGRYSTTLGGASIGYKAITK